MKKTTLLYFMLLGFVFSNFIMAQTINQNASWPNPSWTITGTYNSDPLAFEANPTVVANFAFDDDDAGNVSDDNIAAESPVIDLTAAFTNGEVWLTVTADYIYRYLANDELVFQYWDADTTSWINWGISFDTLGTTTTLTDNFCTGTYVTYVSPVLEITNFTATQLSGFRYRIAYDDNPAGADWNWGFCFQSPTITSSTPPADLLDYYNLQFPASGTIGAGGSFDVYAQAYEAGLTDVTSGQAAGIEAWIGYSANNTNPNGAGWTWVPANFNVEVGNNDEYSLNLGTMIANTGTFYYASRWRLNGGVYTYGGIQSDGSYGGIWGDDNNISGVLTINGPTNDDCAGATQLTPGTVFGDNVLAGQTQLGATDSGELPLPTCSLYDPIDPTGFGGDVWYSVVVPADGNIDIETQGDPTGNGGDSGMSVYSGACGALVEVDCDDDTSADGNYSLISITNPALANQTLYIRVFEYGGNAQLNFQISAYSATLSVSEFENGNAFAYFPNPVKNELTLKAQSNIQNVSIYNMLGQEVLKTAPNTLESEIKMDQLQTGAYFVKVTINDLIKTIRIIKQ
jgi:hypothetical protein